jgi:2-polyprenyl-3-methyl-5-hydroxy-6-metoxy-1,4-benzoquinol methylase
MEFLTPGQPSLRAVAKAFRPKLPRHIIERQANLSDAARAELASFVRRNYIHPEAYWQTPNGFADLDAHSGGRLIELRETYIPWLDSVRSLAGLRILEIGTGTGGSAVALAEQGAAVTGIEMEEAALAVASKLSEVCEIELRLIHANATDAHNMVDVGSYDLVIFFAVLEHMTPIECLESLRAFWSKMKVGAHLALVATPNRLWWYDSHTASLPFFHWLPGEIAIRYCIASPHKGIAELYKDTSADGILRLQRWGRGISFHEIDLAIGSVRELPIVSSFDHWLRRRDFAQMLKFVLRDRPYRQFLRRAARDIPAPWMEPSIELIIRRI